MSRHTRLAALMTVIGFLLRAWDLNGVPLRWDEGWSIAHAALPLTDVLRITGQDVHPPLYYLLFGLWQWLAGQTPFAARWFSVLVSTAAIPLGYACARHLLGTPRASAFATGLLAWLPLGVYYSAVTRMYALAPTFVLLALYGGLRLTAHVPQRRARMLFVIGAAGAMYTLYHAAWALVALGIWLLIRAMHAQRVRALLGAIGLALLVYAPWAIYGLPKLFGRASAEALSNTNQALSPVYFLQLGIDQLLMTQQAGALGSAMIGLLLALGIAAALRERRWSAFSALALPVLMIGFTLAGVAIAARQWSFNARMLICAAPALALALAWAFEQLCALRGALHRIGLASAAIAALALGAVFWRTSTDFVYKKSLEVFDAYSTRTYRETLLPFAQPGDVVVFNVLSPAGFYASQRQPGDPAWTYALTWDPVHEPRADWEARLRSAAAQHDRIWIVLYRGLAQNSENGALRGFMDSTFYPARAIWGEEEVFYGLYGTQREALQAGASAQWPHIALTRSAHAARVKPGGVLPLELTWTLSAPVPANYKVFVHLAKPDGFVIAQHDAAPLNDLRPFSSLQPGEDVLDKHGVVLPPDATGELRIRIGLYDPITQQRLILNNGADSVEIGRVTATLPR